MATKKNESFQLWNDIFMSFLLANICLKSTSWIIILQAHFPGPPVQDLSAPQQVSISRLRAKETSTPASTATSSDSQWVLVQQLVIKLKREFPVSCGLDSTFSSCRFSTASTTIPTFSKVRDAHIVSVLLCSWPQISPYNITLQSLRPGEYGKWSPTKAALDC